MGTGEPAAPSGGRTAHKFSVAGLARRAPATAANSHRSGGLGSGGDGGGNHAGGLACSPGTVGLVTRRGSTAAGCWLAVATTLLVLTSRLRLVGPPDAGAGAGGVLTTIERLVSGNEVRILRQRPYASEPPGWPVRRPAMGARARPATGELAELRYSGARQRLDGWT